MLETTDEHLFWVVGRGWVEVEDLRPGDILTTYEGQELRLVAVDPGYDHNYRQRLRPLPNGEVEYFDGRGRREQFALVKGAAADGEGIYKATGRFVDLTRTNQGWVMRQSARVDPQSRDDLGNFTYLPVRESSESLEVDYNGC